MVTDVRGRGRGAHLVYARCLYWVPYLRIYTHLIRIYTYLYSSHGTNYRVPSRIIEDGSKICVMADNSRRRRLQEDSR